MDDFRKVLYNILSVPHNKNNSNKKRIFKNFHCKQAKFSESKNQELETCLQTRNPARIKFVQKHFEWIPIGKRIRSRYEKCRRISTTLCKYGNQAQREHRHLEAVRWYNLALLFAYPGSMELAAAYANRSLSLHAMGRTEEAVEDIHWALENGYPTGRRMRTQIKERSDDFIQELYKRVEDGSFEQELTEKGIKFNEFYTEMFSLKSPNSLNPAFAKCIEMRKTSSSGSSSNSHVFAKEDIPMGTTVLVERPFVAVLLNALNWDVEHCHHCFKQNWHSIPCPNCVFTMYCSEVCQIEAHEYHKFECPCLPDLHCDLNDSEERNFRLAFKLLCYMGPQLLFELYEKNKDDECDWDTKVMESHVVIDESDPAAEYRKIETYAEVCNLKAVYYPKQVTNSILNALILSRTLELNTTFFDDLPNDKTERENFRFFITKLLLHHYETFTRNAFEIDEIEGHKGVTLRSYIVHEYHSQNNLSYKLQNFGTILQKSACSIHHSCNPNLMRIVGKTFGTIAYIALRDLKKDQELFISYGPEYTSSDKKTTVERRQTLKKRFGFVCDCVACKNNWPAIETLAKSNPVFCCAWCATILSHESKMSPEFKEKFKLSGDFKCKVCDYQHDEKHLKKEFKRHYEMLKVCSQLIDTNAPIEAIQDVKTVMTFFENNVCSPNYFSFVLGPLIYRNAINQIIYFADTDLEI